MSQAATKDDLQELLGYPQTEEMSDVDPFEDDPIIAELEKGLELQQSSTKDEGIEYEIEDEYEDDDDDISGEFSGSILDIEDEEEEIEVEKVEEKENEKIDEPTADALKSEEEDRDSPSDSGSSSGSESENKSRKFTREKSVQPSISEHSSSSSSGGEERFKRPSSPTPRKKEFRVASGLNLPFSNTEDRNTADAAISMILPIAEGLYGLIAGASCFARDSASPSKETLRIDSYLRTSSKIYSCNEQIRDHLPAARYLIDKCVSNMGEMRALEAENTRLRRMVDGMGHEIDDLRNRRPSNRPVGKFGKTKRTPIKQQHFGKNGFKQHSQHPQQSKKPIPAAPPREQRPGNNRIPDNLVGRINIG